MNLEEYHPLPNLQTKNTLIKKARFPVIDAHNHLDDDFGGGWIHKPIAQLLAILDEVNVRVFVDLDGAWGDKILQNHLNKLKQKAPETFRVFCGIDWERWGELGHKFPEWAARQLKLKIGWGADGLKVWKNFGLHVRDQSNMLVPVDDPRLDIIWKTAEDLDIPVMMHTADPAAFFEPLDGQNERFEELSAHPEWHFPSPPYPKFDSLLEGFGRLVEGHPGTTFIGAHMAGYAENLRWVGKMLDRCPNLYVDISGRIGELGRQPYTTRKFMVHYADRILFGLDQGLEKFAYQTTYRFLETDDEYFNYSSGIIPTQGRWFIYGIYLPDDVLKKIYFDNAQKALRLHS